MIYEQEHSIFDKNSLYNKFKSIDTSFEVANGKISAIISDAEIEEYVDGSKTMYSQLNSRISTVEGYKEQISSIQTQVDADGESINQMTSKITEIEASDSEYRISTNNTISNLNNDVSGLTDRVANAELSLQPDNIVLSARKSSLYSSDLSTATNNAVSTTKSWAQSELQIRDNNIAACVKESDVDGNYVVGKINLNSTTAKIQARNINLEGQLTVSAFNQATQAIINSHDMRFFTTNYEWTQTQIDDVSDIGHVTTWTVNEAVDTVAVGNTVILSISNTTKNVTSYIMATVTQIYSVANKQIRCEFIGILEKGLDGAAGATGPQGPAGSPGAKGDTGFQGVSIVSTQMQYYLSTSDSQPTGGSWKDSPSTGWSSGMYYWERAKTTLNDPSKTGAEATSYAYSTPVLATGFNKAISDSSNALGQAHTAATTLAGWASSNDTTLIDGAKIYTGTVGTDQLHANAVTAAKIASESIMANHLRADTLVGQELYVTDTSGRTGWTTTIYYRNSSASTMTDRIANRDSSTWYTTIPAYSASYPYLWAYAKIGDYKSIPVCVAKRSSDTSYTWYHNVNVSEGRIWSAMNDCYIMFDAVSNGNKPERLALMSSEGEVSVGKYNAGDTLSSGDASVNIWGTKDVQIQSGTDVSINATNNVLVVPGDGKALHVYGDVVIHGGTIRYDNDELTS